MPVGSHVPGDASLCPPIRNASLLCPAATLQDLCMTYARTEDAARCKSVGRKQAMWKHMTIGRIVQSG